MSILNFKDWSLNESSDGSNKYTLPNKSAFVYRISSSNKWQYQKVNTKNKDIWHWVTNLSSVNALNKKYGKDLTVHVDIKSSKITNTSKIDIVKTIRDAGKALGWTNNAIAAFIGNVGRENNFNWIYIVGPHNDPKNKATNFGIISWQGSRLDDVKAALKKNGMLQSNGSAKKDNKSIETMVNFVDSEMDKERGDSSLMRKKGASTYEISNMLHNYIRYSKSPPYNTPDSKFHVEKNHYWAAAAKLTGLINYV